MVDFCFQYGVFSSQPCQKALRTPHPPPKEGVKLAQRIEVQWQQAVGPKVQGRKASVQRLTRRKAIGLSPMATERAAFLLPDNGETERGVKTIDGESSLLELSRVASEEKTSS